MGVFQNFHEQLREAIIRDLGWTSLRCVQEQAAATILAEKNAVILAPTAGGKTEASFFPVLSQILQDNQGGLQVLYVAPIKTLLDNQALRLEKYTKMLGLSCCTSYEDVDQNQRNEFLREPDTVLMITPESLEVMLISNKIDHRQLFRNLRFVIVDNIHSFAGNDSGTHLRCVLQRIFEHSKYDVLRIGLSAIVKNPELILNWFCNDSKRDGVIINPKTSEPAKQILIIYSDSNTSQEKVPPTVSSFLQKIGHIKRCEKKTANTTFFCNSNESILQAIAFVELAKEHWVESIELNTRCWAVLVHQILAICLETQEIGITDLWNRLRDIPDFADITEAEFYRLIRFMLQDNSLEHINGRVLIGPKVEKLFGKFNFMNLYAVFSSPQTYTVETKDKHPIGQLAQDFVDQLGEESCFILGGRSWAVESIHHSERVIKSIPAPQGKQPSWGGILPQFLSFTVCQKIKSILLSNEEIPYLKGKSIEILHEERERAYPHLNQSEIISEDGKHRWYTYAGGCINSTLKRVLEIIGNWKITANNFFVEIHEANTHELEQALAKLKNIFFWSEVDLWKKMTQSLPQYRLSKFQNLLPEWATREMLGDYLLDLEGTWQFLSKEQSFRLTQQKTVKKRASETTAELPLDQIECSPQSQLKLPIYYIATDQDLLQMCLELRGSAVLGVDCETTIYPPQRMCLLQIASYESVALIDPLLVKDLSPLKAILEDDATTLVIHNASFEKRFLAMHGIHINSTYDTLVISRELRGKKDHSGEKIRHGLGYVCERELSLTMNKDQQKSNWSQRPLTKAQLMYAALDAEVMLQLYDLFTIEQSQQPNFFD